VLVGPAIAIVAIVYFGSGIVKLVSETRDSEGTASPPDWDQINYRVVLFAALAIGIVAAAIAFHEFDLDVEIVSKSMHDQYMRMVELRRLTFFVSAAVAVGAFLAAWRIFYARVRTPRQGSEGA
jgi:hypothetical protein